MQMHGDAFCTETLSNRLDALFEDLHGTHTSDVPQWK